MSPQPSAFDADTVFAPLRDIRVWDVLLPGSIDRDRPLPEFRPMPQAVYFALDGDDAGYIRVDAVPEDAQLALRRVAEPGCPPEPADLADEDEDEDDEFAVGSCGHDLLGTDAHALPLTRVRYALDDASDRIPGAFRCAEFSFGHARVFLDPMNFFGIRVQGADGYEECLAERRSRTDLSPVREHTWTP